MELISIYKTLNYRKKRFIFYGWIKNQTTLIISSVMVFFITLHFLLSTINSPTQLIEGTAYEVPKFIKNCIKSIKKIYKNTQILIIYIYFKPLTESFIRMYTLYNARKTIKWSKVIKKSNEPKSIETLYNNANWIERELSEMFGVLFKFKNDIRNLLLMYGDIINPMLRLFPTTGIVEYIYSLWLEFVKRSPYAN